jgi:hypothetical protein
MAATETKTQSIESHRPRFVSGTTYVDVDFGDQKVKLSEEDMYATYEFLDQHPLIQVRNGVSRGSKGTRKRVLVGDVKEKALKMLGDGQSYQEIMEATGASYQSVVALKANHKGELTKGNGRGVPGPRKRSS